MNKFAIFDLDGTVYTHTLTFDVAEALIEKLNLEPERKQVQEAKKVWKERGSTESYWAYNKAILEVFEKITPQVSPAQMANVVHEVLAVKGKYCYAYTINLIEKLKKEGRTLIAISGSIKDIVEPFAYALGFDVVTSSELEVNNGLYTGKRLSQTNKNKEKLLADIVAERGLTMEDSIGVGDTHRDSSFLSVVDHPIAFNPNAALYEEAAKYGWMVVLERKNMVYELLLEKGGYMVKSVHPIFEGNHQEQLR